MACKYYFDFDSCYHCSDVKTALPDPVYIVKPWNDGTRGFLVKADNPALWADARNCFTSHPSIDINRPELWFHGNNTHDKGSGMWGIIPALLSKVSRFGY